VGVRARIAVCLKHVATLFDTTPPSPTVLSSRYHLGATVLPARRLPRAHPPALWRPSITANIFIDPSPDRKKASPSASAVRPAALELEDYDKALISEGGGVYSRTLKEIDLSPQAQAALGFSRKPKATPQEVMRAILKAPVDLCSSAAIDLRAVARKATTRPRPRQRSDRVTGADLRSKVVARAPISA